jgi:hypothetical protein
MKWRKMTDYIVLANPKWYKQFKESLTGISAVWLMFAGIPIIEDKWIPEIPGYIICEKVDLGFTYTYIPVNNLDT